PGTGRGPFPADAEGRRPPRPLDQLPFRRRCPRWGRLHLVGLTGLLHDLQPGPADRRGRAAHVSVLAPRDAAARPDAWGCLRRPPGTGDRGSRLAEGGGPPDQPGRLRKAGQEHVPNRRLNLYISPPPGRGSTGQGGGRGCARRLLTLPRPVGTAWSGEYPAKPGGGGVREGY